MGAGYRGGTAGVRMIIACALSFVAGALVGVIAALAYMAPQGRW